jgi:hypothetical protein
MSLLRRGTDPSRAVPINYRPGVFSLRRILTLLALLLGLVKLCACTLLLDTQIRQCQTSADCARFGDSICDPDQQLCVPKPVSMTTLGDAGPGAAGDAGASCTGKNGCFACAPKADPDFFNGCTDARCVPFDNRRLRNLTPDGMLKPLP